MSKTTTRPAWFRALAMATALAPVVATIPVTVAGAAEDPNKQPRQSPVKVNRTVPPARKPPSPLTFSSQPSDTELRTQRVFEEPLIPIGRASTARENAALGGALNSYVRAGGGEDVAALEGFLAEHPETPWRAALLTNLGNIYRRTGYFSKALAAWESAWAASKGATDPTARAIADRAVSELAELNARLGRFDRLESLFAEIAKRDLHGSASEKVVGAREGLARMQHQPGQAFRCGPMALDRILAYANPSYRPDPRITEAQSTSRGTSLSHIRQLAATVRLDMQMAYRSAGAQPVVPAVVHWRAGHFAALVAERAGRYLIQDPTFGNELWVSRKALEDESTGYALVRGGPLPEGWRPVRGDEGEGVWGKGFTFSANPQGQGDDDPTRGGDPPCCTGGCPRMAQYRIHALLAALNVTDEPVGYAPPIGPAVAFQVSYHQREIFQPLVPAYGNLGPKWTYDWLSFLEYNPNDVNDVLNVYLRLGGQETYGNYNPSSSSYGPHARSRAVIVRTADPLSYERRLPDGSVELFATPDGTLGVPRKMFLTSWSDPQGNQVTLNYDPAPQFPTRLLSVTDAIGQVTTLTYDPGDPFKITTVADPLGRFATFEYNAQGQLGKITDVIGITSEFTYDTGDFVSSLTTSYGTTRFATGSSLCFGAPVRWVEATDPVGGVERVEYRSCTDGMPRSEPEGAVPVAEGLATFNDFLDARNTFFWDKRASAFDPTHSDWSKAAIIHWAHDIDTNVSSGIPESEKLPLENRVWYNYPGQPHPANIGNFTAGPSAVARVLDDGTTQLYRYEYNAKGRKIREIDPIGRETVYVYGTNNVPDPDPINGSGLDLLETKVKNTASPGGWDTTARYTYNDKHQPLTVTDAASQTMTYTYDAQDRIETVTTPPRAGITEERTTTYTYDPVTRNVATVTAPGSVDTSYMYDAYGRLRTTTDNDGYTVTYNYDTLDRQTKATYPDGTYEETVYERLDPVRRRDRSGRWTHTFYDALRHPLVTRDPEGRVVTKEWCSCGSLDKLIDANGNATTWTRDLQNRVRFETRANSSAKEFVYETTTSRLSYVKDAKLQEIHYAYAIDNELLQTNYVNAEHPTPNVTFSYTDPATSAPDAHGRLRQVVDGMGTTVYAFHPITGTPSLGAGQLASVDGPRADDTISYGYDELGRVVTRTLGSVTSSWIYDQQWRLQSQGDAIGTFNYGYVANSGRVQTVTYPNNQTTSYSYYPVVQDLRLQEIHHKKPDTTTLSKFNYTYDVIGNIKIWTQQTDLNPANAYDFGYDRADQLTVATYRTTDPMPSILKRYRYAYDPAGNRTAEQIDDVVTGASYDNMNRLMSQQPGGALLFGGTVNEPATVTIGGKPATVGPTNQFSGTAQAPSGTSQVAVQATDPRGNARTNTYEVTQTGASKSFTYDANGNITADGVGTFEWDAEDRLIAVNQGTHRSEFTYDGESRRVRMVERENGSVTSDKTLLWCQREICEQRDSSGTTVQRRFFDQGFQEGTTKYFYAKDHLGSIRETSDNSGILQLRLEFDPYGRPSAPGGSQPLAWSTFGYTGHLHHWDSGVILAPYRGYLSVYGRWASEDPLGRTDRSVLPYVPRWSREGTLYAYVRNNPVGLTDPLGLIATNWCGAGGKGPITSATDWCCWKHDQCYDRCNATWKTKTFGTGGAAKQECIKDCDKVFCNCLKNACPLTKEERRDRRDAQTFFNCLARAPCDEKKGM